MSCAEAEIVNESVKESLNYIKEQNPSFLPEAGIILGTGLGGLVNDVEIVCRLEYKNIPHFPVSTVESHSGALIFGKISGKNAVIMQGRFHFYEGYSMNEITYPVKIMQLLGIKTLLVSNVSGALNPAFGKGDLVIMSSHVNFLFDTPLNSIKRTNFNKKIYDEDLIRLAENTAIENNINIKKGVYISLQGSSIETRAEYRMIRKSGADVVGMSTIPEALFAAYHNIRVLGISIITDLGFPDSLKPAVVAEIIEAASEAESKLTLLTKKILEKI